MKDAGSVPSSSRDEALRSVRRTGGSSIAAGALLLSVLQQQAVWAEETTAAAPAAPVKVELGPAPVDFGLVKNDYYTDAQKVTEKNMN